MLFISGGNEIIETRYRYMLIKKQPRSIIDSSPPARENKSRFEYLIGSLLRLAFSVSHKTRAHSPSWKYST